MSVTVPPQTGFVPHDHATCIGAALAAAERLCAERKLRLTPVRRRVLEILLERHRALGAYDVLEVLAAEGLGAQPPVAYRALDFLVQNGLAHRIERLNAFAACTHASADHVPAFLICRACGAVDETATDSPRAGLGSAAERTGFTIEQISVEALGLCPACTDTP
jgi:Fur family zinc uptake transcriptional regulator